MLQKPYRFAACEFRLHDSMVFSMVLYGAENQRMALDSSVGAGFPDKHISILSKDLIQLCFSEHGVPPGYNGDILRFNGDPLANLSDILASFHCFFFFPISFLTPIIGRKQAAENSPV